MSDSLHHAADVFFKSSALTHKEILRGNKKSLGRQTVAASGPIAVQGVIPSHPDGWFLATHTKSENCTFNGDQMQVAQLNVCIPRSTSGTLIKYNTETQKIERFLYENDITCTTAVPTSIQFDNATCNFDEDGYSNGVYAVLSAEIPLYDAYVTREFFYDGNCSSSPLMFTALRNKHCFANNLSEAVYYDFPNFTTYESFESCSGNVTNVMTLPPDVCVDYSGTDDTYGDDYYYGDDDDVVPYTNTRISLIEPGSSPLPSSTSSSSSNDKLSDGAVAGIAIGAAAAVAIIVGLIFFLFVAKRNSKGDDVPLTSNPVHANKDKDVQALSIEKGKATGDEHA